MKPATIHLLFATDPEDGRVKLVCLVSPPKSLQAALEVLGREALGSATIIIKDVTVNVFITHAARYTSYEYLTRLIIV